MSEVPFFSVIIPVHNRPDFIRVAIESVLAQTYRDFELIVVDDGSTDGTADIVKDYVRQNPDQVQYVCQENQGPASARNVGVKQAQGQFIAFLDSDDRWVPEKLIRAVETIQQYPAIKIFHTEEVWYRQGELLQQKKKHKKPDGFVYRQALPLCCISISTVLIHRDVFDTVGLFDETFPACEDYEFWLRATSRYEIKLIPEYLTLKDGGRPDQVSAKVWGLDRFRIKALDRMIESGTLSLEDHQATVKELTKKCRIFAQGARKRGKQDSADMYLKLMEKYQEEIPSDEKKSC